MAVGIVEICMKPINRLTISTFQRMACIMMTDSHLRQAGSWLSTDNGVSDCQSPGYSMSPSEAMLLH